MGVGRGTVCAVLEPVWSLPHLIDPSVLRLPYVTTNNGTPTGYYKFDPQILLRAETASVTPIAIPTSQTASV